MEGDRYIKLTNPKGVDTNGDSKVYDYNVHARKIDRRGFQYSEGEIFYTEHTTVFRIRMVGFEKHSPDPNRRINNQWTVVDEDGIKYRIETISEDNKTRRRFWYVHCVAR